MNDKLNYLFHFAPFFNERIVSVRVVFRALEIVVAALFSGVSGVAAAVADIAASSGLTTVVTRPDKEALRVEDAYDDILK